MMHGILNVYKEKGYTSHDVVARLRRITGQKKIGHTGTLDPDASGVLPVCLGKATKLCEFLTDKDKCYEAVLLLGVETDTQDISGTVLRTADTGDLSGDEVRRAAGSFVGGYAQLPPMYSALKVNGKRLYELAREGKTVERQARRVEIYELRLLSVELPRVRMRVHCSKGTYIRTLCHDIGAELGCGGCMEELVRTRAGTFSVEDSLTLEEIERKKEDGSLASVLVPPDRMFPGYARVTVKKEWEICAHNGGALPESGVTWEEPFADRERARVYDGQQDFIGIYQYEKEKKEFSVVKMFYQERQ